MLYMFKKDSKVKQMLGALLVLGLLSEVGIEGALIGGLIGYGVYKAIKNYGIPTQLEACIKNIYVYKLLLGIFVLIMVGFLALKSILFLVIGAVSYYVYEKHGVKEQVIVFKKKLHLLSIGYRSLKTKDSDVLFSFSNNELVLYSSNTKMERATFLSQHQVTAIQNYKAEDFDKVEVLEQKNDTFFEVSYELADLNEKKYKFLEGGTLDVMFRVFENGVYIFGFIGNELKTDGIFLENAIFNEITRFLDTTSKINSEIK